MNKWFPISAAILPKCSWKTNNVWVQKLGPCIQLRYKFETYAEASKSKGSSKLLGPQVVCSLLSVLRNPTCHRVYFDNFFTSYSFSGTWDNTRKPHNEMPTKVIESRSQRELGFYDYRSDDYVSVVQWKDNKVVYIASNFVNITPIKMVKRYSQREKKKIDCPQPSCFYQYNQGMEGIDLLDRFISQYRPNIYGKKWYCPLFLNCFQML